MNLNKDDVIDLSPIRIDLIETKDEYVSVILKRQPCYTRMEKLGEPIEYECEMRFYNGHVQLMNEKLYFETDDWELLHSTGSNACFLPFGFQANGPIKLVVRDDKRDKNAIIVLGERFDFIVLNKAQPVQQIDPIAQELYEYISELSELAIRAGWMEHIEFSLWDRVLNGSGDYYALDVTDDIIAQLHEYSKKAGVWWHWRNREAEFLSLDEWQKIYDEFPDRRYRSPDARGA